MKTVFHQLKKLILAFGPGIFAIGYTIGTGSVTSMIVAGSSFGMQLLWNFPNLRMNEALLRSKELSV